MSLTRLQAQNIVQMLQHDPLYYRAFGPYWWPVKAELRRHGFGTDHAAHLGTYVDPEARGLFEGETTAEVLEDALRYQAGRLHALHSPYHSTPDGEAYTLRDFDFE